MIIAFSALAWVYAAGTCVSVVVAAITIPLALRHQHQRRNEDFGIVSVSEGRVTISRTWTVGDQVAVPELQAKALALVRIQRQHLAEQNRLEQKESQSRDDKQANMEHSRSARADAIDELLASRVLDDSSPPPDDIQAELDQLSGRAGVDEGSATTERSKKPGEEPSPGENPET